MSIPAVNVIIVGLAIGAGAVLHSQYAWSLTDLLLFSLLCFVAGGIFAVIHEIGKAVIRKARRR